MHHGNGSGLQDLGFWIQLYGLKLWIRLGLLGILDSDSGLKPLHYRDLEWTVDARQWDPGIKSGSTVCDSGLKSSSWESGSIQTQNAVRLHESPFIHVVISLNLDLSSACLLSSTPLPDPVSMKHLNPPIPIITKDSHYERPKANPEKKLPDMLKEK